MATGRTVPKHVRVYGGGYQLCGYTQTIGPLNWSYDTAALTTMCDSATGILNNQPHIGLGTLNGVFDNTATTGLHALASTPAAWDMMVAVGIRAAPAAGDPVFCGKFMQSGYTMVENAGAVTVTMPFTEWDAGDLPTYDVPWGRLIHAYGAETAANSTTGAGVNNGAATTAGGYMMYQVFAGNGTATISIDDSADDTTYGALSGATTGELNFSTAQAGIVSLGTTATVKQYLRWQLALNSATTVTFALAFVRGR